jgi:hypothetical protein
VRAEGVLPAADGVCRRGLSAGGDCRRGRPGRRRAAVRLRA